MKNDDEPGYEVGKGKPPRHSQFKTGQSSANPRGRPSKPTPEEQARRTLKKLIEEIVTIREGQRTMKVTALEAYARRLRAQALSTGSVKAGREWLELTLKFGALFKEADTGDVAPANHRAIVARFLARTRGEASPVENLDPQADETADPTDIGQADSTPIISTAHR